MGRIRSGLVWTGQDRTGLVWSGLVWSGQDRTGQARSRQVTPGQVRSGQVMKTEHSTRRVFHMCTSSNAPALAQGSRLDERESRVENIALAPQSLLHLMNCRNLLGLPDRRSTFPDGLETESGIPASIPATVAGLAEWPNSPRSQVVSGRT